MPVRVEKIDRALCQRVVVLSQGVAPFDHFIYNRWTVSDICMTEMVFSI